MPIWGIVLIGLAFWVLVSAVLGVLIGRAVRIADAHRRDEVLTRQLARRPLPIVRSDVRVAASAESAPSVVRVAAG